jgi:hypothetical protein
MNRRLFWLVVIIAVVSSALLVRSVVKTHRQQALDVANQSALLTYSQRLRPGLTRKNVEDYLRAQGTHFKEACCYGERNAFAVLVKVGEEDVPWFCSECPVYAVFEFTATPPPQLLPKPTDSDVLKNIHLASGCEGCL